MREIKFRAWDNVENKMHYCGEEIDMIFEVRDNRIECTDIRNVSPGGEGVESMEHLTYMQYTGLKDKNGTEIYEGDILLIQADGYDSIISEVVWGGTEYPAFDLPKYDGYEMNAFSAIYHNDIKETLEVIGNIYENPELLEVD